MRIISLFGLTIFRLSAARRPLRIEFRPYKKSIIKPVAAARRHAAFITLYIHKILCVMGWRTSRTCLYRRHTFRKLLCTFASHLCTNRTRRETKNKTLDYIKLVSLLLLFYFSAFPLYTKTIYTNAWA